MTAGKDRLGRSSPEKNLAIIGERDARLLYRGCVGIVSIGLTEFVPRQRESGVREERDHHS
jgi:hypothetical protein